MSFPALEDIPEDEWNFDFGDNKGFLITRWDATLVQCQRVSTSVDWQRALSVTNPGRLGRYLKALQDHSRDVVIQSKVGYVMQAVEVFKQLADEIDISMAPSSLDLSMIWGLTALLIESTITQSTRLDHIVSAFSRFRVVIRRTMGCVGAYPSEKKEARLTMVISMGELALVLADTMRFVRENPSDPNLWPQDQQDCINSAITKMENGVRDLYNVASTSQNLEQVQAGFMSFVERRRAGAPARMDDSDVFPCVFLPSQRNEKFYGREEQLEEIDSYLNPRVRQLRTYTIYGRRGVGKTNIALEYAYRNPSGFDAIFWINCETATALRLSFTRMALLLKLGGVEPTGHHEENLIICHKWLARTEKTWLLIFDNAEDDALLRRYWPESTGAIIITSRRWFNFNNNALRQGQTIQPFKPAEGWELFVLFAEWGDKIINHEISEDEVAAAKELVQEFEGLPLAIGQAASLVESTRFPSIRQLLLAYRDAATNAVPHRPSHQHSTSTTNHAVDSIWYVSFQNLSRNAKAILSVLCLLSPDVTYIDVFMPRSQSVITEFLAFCRQPSQASLTLTVEARAALKELLDASLIRQEGRIISVHRVVQEAFFYVNKTERQDAFTAAARLIYDAFPKQINGRPLHSAWERCERYIQDAIYLADRYVEFGKIKDPVKPPPELRWLLMNAAWYLYEIGDWRDGLRIATIGYDLCQPDSLNYAHLRNTAGSCYHELMELDNARIAWEDALAIREKNSQKPAEIEELATTINNYANLAYSEGLYDLCLERHEKARAMRTMLEEQGEEIQVTLAITHLGIGRARIDLKLYDEAALSLDLVESLILAVAPANSPYMADLYYARGNLALAEGAYSTARSHYEKSRGILNATNPTALLVASVHYKIACVEFVSGEIPNAKRHLDVAYDLVELRRQDVDDPNMARILWKKSQILKSQIKGFVAQHDQEEAARLKWQAEQMVVNLQQIPVNVTRIYTDAPEQKIYDDLICGFFR